MKKKKKKRKEKKKKGKKKVKENKETQGEARGESTQISLFWFALWVNYQNFNVTIKAAINLIPFSCMLRTFLQRRRYSLTSVIALSLWVCHIVYRADDPRSFHYKNPLHYPSISNERTEQTESENTSTKKWKQNWLWVFFFCCHFF